MKIEILLYWQSGGDATGVVCYGGVILFIAVIVIVAVQASNEQTKQLNTARDAYFDALRRLKANPTNADLRQRTLQLGRTYSNLTRNKSGVTVFDEVALSNDINAACAGAATLVASKQTDTQTIESRLQKLAELKNKGLIDGEEYATRRKEILDEV
jgi:hypothetical protein